LIDAPADGLEESMPSAPASTVGRIFAALGAEPSLAAGFLEQLSVAVAIFDGDGRIQLQNSSFAQIVGAVPARVQDLPLVVDHPTSPLARALAGEAITGEDHDLRVGETTRRVRLSATPVRDETHAVIGGALVLIDAAERPGAEASAREIMGIVGHDLRNPLAAIRMTAQLLNKGDEMPTERRLTLSKRILTSSGRMDSIVKGLLDYARARAGALVRLEREPTDLAPLLARIVEDQELAFPNRVIRQDVTGDTTGEWDPARLEQIVTNLVSNALRHGAPDQPVVITIDGSAPDEVRVTVHNHGHPIPPDLLLHLFEPFSIGPRAEGTPRRSIGLGLFIVKEFVTAHGGDVTVESSAQEGTRFTVRLPRRV
jgi:phosphoserine phosphatase RsbU/P